MPPVILTIDSASDVVTSAALAFRELNVYARITPPAARLVRRQGAAAVRSAIVPLTHGGSIDMIMGVGHGTTTAFDGNDAAPVFAFGGYDSVEVLGRAIHLTSCSTAKALGADMVRNGAKFFIGYVQDVLFQAQLANYIFDSDAEVDRALISGKTAGQAQQSALDRFNFYIRSFTKAGASSYLVQQLIYNRNILRGPLSDPAYGDPNARL